MEASSFLEANREILLWLRTPHQDSRPADVPCRCDVHLGNAAVLQIDLGQRRIMGLEG